MKARKQSLFTGNVICGCRYLYRCGDAVEPLEPFCYKVTRGFVLLTLETATRDIIVALLKAGDYFGEESFLAFNQRRHSAIAMKGSDVMVMPTSPVVLTALLNDVVERDYFRTQLLALGSAAAKAEFVRSRYQDLRLTATVIARMLGVSRESVSRARVVREGSITD